MLIILIIIVLLIAIIISSIQYYKAFARLHSHTAFNEAAQREMKKIRYEDPHISCDYCGAVIDTSKDKVCPQCGADYSKDEEWRRRFQFDEDWVDEKAEAEAQKEISKAEAEARRIAKRIRRLIIIVVVIILAFVALAVAVTYLDKKNRYAESEELNEYSFEHYEKADYDVVGDGVLLDEGGVLISIEAIYYDKTNDNVKIGYRIENNNNYDCTICMYGLAVNGYAHTFSFVYDTFRKNSDTLLYCRDYEGSTVESLIYGKFSIRDSQYNSLYESEDTVEVRTSAYAGTVPVLKDGTVLYDNDKVSIVGLGYDEDDHYSYEILNKTDETLKIDCRDGKFKDNSVSVYGDYDFILPGKCVSDQTSLHLYDDTFINRNSSDLLYVNFEFTDPEKPEYDFSTGYIALK